MSSTQVKLPIGGRQWLWFFCVTGTDTDTIQLRTIQSHSEHHTSLDRHFQDLYFDTNLKDSTTRVWKFIFFKLTPTYRKSRLCTHLFTASIHLCSQCPVRYLCKKGLLHVHIIKTSLILHVHHRKLRNLVFRRCTTNAPNRSTDASDRGI